MLFPQKIPPEFPQSTGSMGWCCVCWIHPQPPVGMAAQGCTQHHTGSPGRAGMELKAPKAQADALITESSLISQSFTFLTKAPPFSRAFESLP